ncbi:peptidase U32 [Oscillospiraceae bacterium]|nr:peptidase U32 [Oscillospiraceae bacterium]BDF74232.1 peptidase U32 [Oscillospiraceae bacterium]
MAPTSKQIELLAPAGDMERLEMSVAYGADAVYLAGPDFGMRCFAGNFSRDELRRAVAFCHSRGVRVHVTCNTMPRNGEADRLPAWLEYLDDVGADAAIVADVGVFSLAGKYAPHLERHVSTQASVASWLSARAWYELGASRVILARELSLDEIREIRAKTPPALELEAFVHGSMCVSYSGRCLLSNYMTGRDANRGACAQPCRYKYALVEEKRPGEYFPIGEDETGAYIMNSRDMCMIDHIPELLDAGLSSLKIEGRAKSAYYAAVTTGAYRHAVDAALAGAPLEAVWRDEVEKVSHRPYSTGFYYGRPGQYTADARYVRDWQIVAVVEACGADGSAVCSLRNKFARGDALELVGPGMAGTAFAAGEMADLDGLPLDEPRSPQMKFTLRLPRPAPPLSILRRRAFGL